MPEEQLTEDADFQVKEYLTLDITFAIILYVVALSGIAGESQNNIHHPAISVVSCLAILPAVAFTIKAILNRTSITVNKTGIYHYKIFLTNWNNFINAWVEEQHSKSGYYYFVLIVAFYKDGEEGSFERIMKLDSTQNKSEEEIIAAIKFFDDAAKKGVVTKEV